MKTIIHETIHHCIGQLDETLDEEQEEQAMFWMQWIDSELVFSEYDI